MSAFSSPASMRGRLPTRSSRLPCFWNAIGWPRTFTTRWRRASPVFSCSCRPPPTRRSQAQARLHIAQARDLARGSLQDARRSVRALRPQALESEPLSGALASLIRQTAALLAANVTFQVHGQPRSLLGAVENHLFRIRQEALTNAVKHSEAAHIKIDLFFEPNQTRLRVQDDGRGFEFQSGLQGDGFGLIGIYERAERIEAGITLDTHTGQGTSLAVTVPAPSAPTEEKRP